MGTSFPVPTLDETHGLIVADHRNRIPEDDVSRFSDNWRRDRVLAGAVTSLHAHIDAAYEDLMPDGAAGAQLDRIGKIYDVTRKSATVASKADALRVYGNVGSSVAVGDKLTHTDGSEYQVNEAATIPGGGTFVDVDVLSITKGSIAKKKAAEVLKFTSPPAGIETNAELQKDIDEGGDDEEKDGPYQVRILDKISQPGMGGAANDYRTWALEVAGIATAYVYPNRNGVGSVDVACLKTGRGAVRLPSAGERQSVLDNLNKKRPVSVKDVRVLTALETLQDVEITLDVYDDPAYKFDWIDTTPPTVVSWTAATRVLKLSLRPGDMKAGHRMIVKNTATRNNGAQLVVESLGPAADEVTISPKTLPNVAPEVGVNVYSGGPLVDTVRDAVLAHVDALGTARGTYAAAGLIWESTLRTAVLYRFAVATEGVRDATVSVPGANVVASDPAGTDIYVITPRQVIVRRT